MVATAPTRTAVRRRKQAPDADGTLTVGRSATGTFFANLAGIVFSLIMIFPVYWVINTAFKPGPEVLQLTM